MFGECTAVRPLLGPFVDDELAGAEMIRVSEHLEECASCRAEVGSIRDTGDWLRTHGMPEDVPGMDGLASGVISRVRAERANSWGSLFSRAVDNWHWAIVGLGSMAGTTASTLIIACVLWFGPAPERGDSLSAMLTELTGKDTMFVVQPTTRSWEHVAWTVGGGDPAGGGVTSYPVMLVFPGASQQELVRDLADVLAPKGRLIRLESMSESNRLYTERLLDDLSRMRTATNRVLLMSSTTVTAKGL
jgi:hypothetical protein